VSTSEQQNITHDQTPPKTKWIFISLFSVTMFLVVFTGYAFYLYKNTTSQELNAKEKMAGEVYSLQKTRIYEKEELTSFTWIDQAQQKVKIPIEDAMQLVVERYRTK